MNSIEIQKISIVDLDVDAVVNAANEALAAGGGVCGAIFRAAGREELQAACDAFGHCATGSAVITPGFRLKAKYVIHAVGPIWRGGKFGEPEQLRSAYQQALALAAANGCRSIGFPLISAGIYGYPVQQAWQVALTACADYLAEPKNDRLKVIFAVLDDDIMTIGNNCLLHSQICDGKPPEQ